MNIVTQLKYEPKFVEKIITEMESLSKKTSLTKKIKDKLLSTITYFKNNKHMMDYSTHIADNLPIGSGVTEAACYNIS
ncbi:hypothetical protein QUF74_14915 [Candidatus Halobeggiatoa sp. HSG11]|nr:hypothetical protein [Candidatus Halobeggiatoa sp. HSG11]